LRRRYTNFSLENTDRTVQWFQGQDKYPIKFWNDTDEKQDEIRTISQANFFFKSAYKVIEGLKKEEQQLEESRRDRNNVQSGHIGSAAGGLGNSSAPNREGVLPPSNCSMSLDHIFKNMLTVNRVKEPASHGQPKQ
jgi:hypothetical protein